MEKEQNKEPLVKQTKPVTPQPSLLEIYGGLMIDKEILDNKIIEVKKQIIQMSNMKQQAHMQAQEAMKRKEKKDGKDNV